MNQAASSMAEALSIIGSNIVERLSEVPVQHDPVRLESVPADLEESERLNSLYSVPPLSKEYSDKVEEDGVRRTGAC